MARIPDLIRLDGRQLALLEALRRQDERLAAMYRGALEVLADDGNVEQLPQAAHSVRELMEKIPQYLRLPVNVQRQTLKERVFQIQDHWNQAVKADIDQAIENFMGNRRALKSLITKIDRFFKWVVDYYPRRKEEIATNLRDLNGSGNVLPPGLMDLNVEEWVMVRDYFVNVAHHRTETSKDEFVQWLHALETRLLDMFRPRTFEDFDEIDKTIVEGENGA